MTRIRLATSDDVPALTALIDRSVHGLQAADYVYGVDSDLIADGTYFAVEADGVLAACGGWSRRKTLYGGDAWAHRDGRVSRSRRGRS